PMSLQKARELRQDRAKVWDEAKKLRNEAEGRAFTSEEQEKWERLNGRLDELGTEIHDIEDREARFLEMEEEIGYTQERLDEGRGFGEERKSAEELVERERGAFRRWLRSLSYDADPMDRREAHKELRDVRKELRATGEQTVGTSGQGGVTVPTDFNARIIEQMQAFGGMRRSRATVIQTGHGRDIDYPTVDDTSNVATIVGEGSTFTSTHVPFGKVTLEATKYGVIVKISDEVLQDSAIDIEAVVRDQLARRFGRGTERHYAVRSSTESTGPHGLINASTGAVSIVAGTTTLGYDEWVALQHAVDPAYRAMGEYMFPDNVLEIARKTKDDNGLPIWNPGMASNEPDRILGKPYVVNQSLNDGGDGTDQDIEDSGTKPLWFGDFSHYWIRDALGMSLRVLQERYAPEGMVGILGFMRTDGRPAFATSTAARKPIRALVTTT
ncbi:MAG: phage major capsid protein, partial [Gemmatimonadota bacterium]